MPRPRATTQTDILNFALQATGLKPVPRADRCLNCGDAVDPRVGDLCTPCADGLGLLEEQS